MQAPKAAGKTASRPADRTARSLDVTAAVADSAGPSDRSKAAIARKILIATWHVLALQQPFKPSATRATDPVPASSCIRLAA
jgi:hypothetical protein